MEQNTDKIIQSSNKVTLEFLAMTDCAFMELIEKQEDVDPQIVKMVNDNFLYLLA